MYASAVPKLKPIYYCKGNHAGSVCKTRSTQDGGASSSIQSSRRTIVKGTKPSATSNSPNRQDDRGNVTGAYSRHKRFGSERNEAKFRTTQNHAMTDPPSIGDASEETANEIAASAVAKAKTPEKNVPMGRHDMQKWGQQKSQQNEMGWTRRKNER